MFFPVGLTGPAVQQIADAKAICRGCPVRLVCLQYALAAHLDDGVWGGYDEGGRRELRRRWRRLGRPLRFVPGAAPDEERLSIGIEDKEDLIADLEQALGA